MMIRIAGRDFFVGRRSASSALSFRKWLLWRKNGELTTFISFLGFYIFWLKE